MGPVEAFGKLGYRLANPYDWSAREGVRICIALWRDEIAWKREVTPVFDSRVDAGPGEWRSSPKAIARIDLLSQARETRRGRIDVVIRDGKPDDNPGTAEAWNRPGTYWKCDQLDHADFVVRLYQE